MIGITVRETPAWKVRERWAHTRRLQIERDLHAANRAEFGAENRSAPNQQPLWLQCWIDLLGVVLCRMTHRTAVVDWCDSFYACPDCGRRYATPWADESRLDGDVYVAETSPVTTEGKTRQAECRSGSYTPRVIGTDPATGVPA